MKKVLFSLFALLFAASISTAQEEGKKLAKKAGKALTSYNIDPSGNSAKLAEAKETIEEALKLPDGQTLASAWLTKGDIYNTMLQKDLARKQFDPKAPFTGDNDALVAFDAYKKVVELSTVKYEKSDAVKGIGEVQASLINIGVAKYEAKEFEKAFFSFRASVEAHEILTENNKKSFLDDPKQLDDQTYFTGLIASLANRCKDAVIYYERLFKKGNATAAVYEGLYTCQAQLGDEAAASKVLTEGRKKYPEDPALLFAEINAYLKAGKLNELTDRLKQAIVQEPDNIGLYVTLGNIYDNLYQAALKNKDEAKAKEYFELANKTYLEAIAKKPDQLDANYSIGALYYNKAAARTQDMNALPEDFSAAGLAKMKVIRDEVMELFDKALPYFQKAESIDPNDLNTLIALNEIYARKDDEKMSPIIKKRLDTVKEGGKNADSQFKKQ
jgi:tetratricopeptide (TPR) repeat protein